ncbi:MAG: cell division protein FtsL [Lachnospiraceae bacterium]|nr:cell division protein FtsL [Lachnospiraceae bacterium]
MSTRTNRTSRSYDRNRTYGRSGGYGEYYIDGSAVRKIDVRKEIEEAPITRTSHTVRRNREKAAHMNVGYVAFLALALCAASVILIGYIRLQAENTAALETIAQKESQLNALRLANDEEYSRIISSVDLEYVKDVAINELGMQYAQEGQIVEVETQGDDYVRQYRDMP